MGKKVYFNLIKANRIMEGFADKYNYKSNIHKILYIGKTIYNVRWQASNLTYCSFRETHLRGIDFFNSNLKKTSFKNAYLEDVVFFNCNLKGVDFTNAKLRRVIFISINLDLTKNLIINDTCKVYNSYPKINIADSTKQKLFSLTENFSKNERGVLFVNRTKINLWVIKILVDIYGEDFYQGLFLSNDKPKKLFTIYSYIKLIEKNLGL